jgi:CheY-like chemotaxis protein
MAEETPVPKELPPILIGDADSDNASHMERQLRRAGVRNPVVTFQNGDDLLAYLSEAATHEAPMPCALLLDPRMPGANGYDPVRWIRREKGGTDVLVAIFSSAEDEDEVESASELGVEHFLKKHADLGSLAAVVGRVCGCPVSPDDVPPPAILPVAPAT